MRDRQKLRSGSVEPAVCRVEIKATAAGTEALSRVAGVEGSKREG